MVLDSRRHPQQSYRSCLGILGLAKKYSTKRLEAACDWALTTGIHSYKGVKNILKHNMDRLEPDVPPATALPVHDNIRGESYYT